MQEVVTAVPQGNNVNFWKSVMIKNSLRLFLIPFVLLASLVLSACGGGSGASGSGDGSTGNPGTKPEEAVPTLKLSMTANRGGGTVVNSITAGTSAYLNATLKNEKQQAVSGAVVTFTVPAGIVTMTPSAGTALTDSNGVASVRIDSAGTTAEGAGLATAAATWGDGNSSKTATSAPLGFAVGSASVTFGSITISPNNLSAYGSANVSVPVLVNGAPTTVPLSVTFTSNCVGSGRATITSPVTTVNGVATTTYKDTNSCASADTITASVSGAAADATATIVVASPLANNIQFTSATPAVIGIDGTGLPTSSVVKFKVVDANNNGVAGKKVNFSLTPVLAAGAPSLSITSASSDAGGEVAVSVTAGSTPTPVWVVATLDGTPAIKSQSVALTVTTGLPTQDFFSLSASTHNIEGLNIDGTTSTLTVIASDRLGNPVPDKTAINFVTEGGQIQGGTDGRATCATLAGACSVTLRSANARPTNGRVTVLAYVLGEKSFVDGNANNVWDAGETYYDLGDPFIDANEDGVWNAGEQSWSYASGTSACGAHVSGSATATAYPASYADAPSKTSTCNASMSGTNIRAYVRRLGVLTFSGSTAYISTNSFTMGAVCKRSFSLDVRDVNNNPMPKGSTISVGNNDVTLIKADGKPVNAVITVNNPEVPDSTAVGGTTHSFTIDGGNEDCPGIAPKVYPAGNFDLKVTTPSGNVTLLPITIN